MPDGSNPVTLHLHRCTPLEAGRTTDPGAVFRLAVVRQWQENIFHPSTHRNRAGDPHLPASTQWRRLEGRKLSVRSRLDRLPPRRGTPLVSLSCPGLRAAILYSNGIFACRHCFQLAYPSQRESCDDRAARKANRIRDKLGWKPGILNSKGWKSKGMHWDTFERLTTQHDAFVQITLAGMVIRLNLLGESLDDWI